MSEHEHRTTTEEILSLAELGSDLLEQARTTTPGGPPGPSAPVPPCARP